MANVFNTILITRSSISILSKLNTLYTQPNTRQFYKAVTGYVKKKNKPKVAVVNCVGMIQAEKGDKFGFAAKPLNLESLRKSLDKAFTTKGVKEVCLVINSPGGSPVQSDLIANRILHLSKTKQIEVNAFVEDSAVSGGYWLACTGKRIYITENSITGSLGVIAGSFGFQDFIKRFDIDRRVMKAGKHKDIMDPFQPEKEEHKEIMQRSLERVYENFINYVKRQRGDRLTGSDEELFTGQFWAGKDAIDLGLVDEIMTLNDYIYEKYEDNVDVMYVNSSKSGLLSQLMGSSFSISDLENSLIESKFRIW